jgi:TRAP-type C4-dicarboxylate transport system substrate-binding protein
VRRLLVVFVALLLTGLVAAQQAAWDMHIAWPESNYHTQGALRFAELLDERTDGAIDVTVHSGGSLGYRGPEVLRVVRNGVVPIAEVFMENVVGDEPIFGLFALPLTTDYDEAWELYQIAKPYFEEALERHNQIMLWTSPWAPQGLYVQERVEQPSDLEGLTVRTSGENLTRFVDALGARAITIPFGELYTALATGVVNSVVTSPTTGVDASLWEVSDYFYPTFIPNIPLNFATLNRNAFNRLSPEQQEIVLETAQEVEAFLWETAREQRTEDQQRLAEEGMTIVTEVPEAVVEHFRTPAEELVDNWAQSTGEAGEAILGEFRGE